MNNVDYLAPVCFAYRLKHPHLNSNVDHENFRHFLGLIDVSFQDAPKDCVNYIFEKKYNVRPFSTPTKIEHLLEVLKNLSQVSFAIIQKEGVYYYSNENTFEDRDTIVIYGNHCYLLKEITKVFEIDVFADLNVKHRINRVRLQGYDNGSYKLCKRCVVKYQPKWFDVGFCSITCAALGLPVDKKCKGCQKMYLSIKFLDSSYCSIMCRCFPTPEQQAKMWLFFDRDQEDLLCTYRNDLLENEDLYLLYAAQDFFKRLESGHLTKEDIVLINRKILEGKAKIGEDVPNIYILDSKEDVFAKAKNRKGKKKLHPYIGEYYYGDGFPRIEGCVTKEEFVQVDQRNEDGYYKAYRSTEYLDKYTMNLDPLLLKDLKENLHSHYHLCFSCGNSYSHSHKYFNENHPQFIKQCAYPDCAMYGLKSKPVVKVKSLYDLNANLRIEDTSNELRIINSLNIVNPKPNFSLNKLVSYPNVDLAKNFKNGEKEHPHPNLAFDRFFLEKWMYSEVFKEAHYVMAAAPLRISKYNDENFFSVPYVVETDLKRQEELRQVPNKFCKHLLEDCDCVSKFDRMSGTHVLYYINNKNYHRIRHMKYIMFVTHLYFDNLPKREIKELKYTDKKVTMDVIGNDVAYEHAHPIEALRLLAQDFNIVVIGSMAYTQLLFLTNKKFSNGTSDFIERYEKGLSLRGVTGNPNDFDMLENDFDIY